MFQREVEEGKRYEFGKNWQGFLSVLDEERISVAESSLTQMLGLKSLAGKRFLDAGSGSGLFSLAARRLGAVVHSFDYDPRSVACTAELKRRYFPDDEGWTIEEGSILDIEYLKALGEFDIVYSWGVVPFTGDMWGALRNLQAPVKQDGLIFFSVYNNEGNRSRFWRKVKQINCSGRLGKIITIGIFIPYYFLYYLAVDLLLLRNPYKRYSEYKKNRGMSKLHDWFDWLGGYPFEVARPEEVFEFFKENNFLLVKLKTTGLLEFVFKRV